MLPVLAGIPHSRCSHPMVDIADVTVPRCRGGPTTSQLKRISILTCFLAACFGMQPMPQPPISTVLPEALSFSSSSISCTLFPSLFWLNQAIFKCTIFHYKCICNAQLRQLFLSHSSGGGKLLNFSTIISLCVQVERTNI